MKPSINILISGGGTGGHIYPAIAIANEIKLRYPDAHILFVGAKGKMEMHKVPQAGYEIVGLWISGIQRRFTIENLSFPFKLIHSLWKARKIIKQFKPDIAIGTGGFASGPILMAANQKEIPTLIQEQNSFPGITNRYLGKKANTICIAYDHLERFFPKEKLVKTGNPVRADLLSIHKKVKINASRELFELKKKRKTVLVLGGSLGARKINELIASNIPLFKAQKTQIIWQCGQLYYDEYKVYNSKKHIHVYAFIHRMDLAYAAADIVISRAGASSVSELCIVGKPTILIPSPNVAEDHQTKNAKSLSDKHAAILLKESELDTFPILFESLIKDEGKLENLSQHIKELALPNATNHIVNQVEKLLNL